MSLKKQRVLRRQSGKHSRSWRATRRHQLRYAQRDHSLAVSTAKRCTCVLLVHDMQEGSLAPKGSGWWECQSIDSPMHSSSAAHAAHPETRQLETGIPSADTEIARFYQARTLLLGHDPGQT